MGLTGETEDGGPDIRFGSAIKPGFDEGIERASGDAYGEECTDDDREDFGPTEDDHPGGDRDNEAEDDLEDFERWEFSFGAVDDGENDDCSEHDSALE